MYHFRPLPDNDLVSIASSISSLSDSDQSVDTSSCNSPMSETIAIPPSHSAPMVNFPSAPMVWPWYSYNYMYPNGIPMQQQPTPSGPGMLSQTPTPPGPYMLTPSGMMPLPPMGMLPPTQSGVIPLPPTCMLPPTPSGMLPHTPLGPGSSQPGRSATHTKERANKKRESQPKGLYMYF